MAKVEIKEVQIRVDIPDSFRRRFEATLRDSNLQEISKLKDLPNRLEIEAYIQFLNEVLEEMS